MGRFIVLDPSSSEEKNPVSCLPITKKEVQPLLDLTGVWETAHVSASESLSFGAFGKERQPPPKAPLGV